MAKKKRQSARGDGSSKRVRRCPVREHTIATAGPCDEDSLTGPELGSAVGRPADHDPSSVAGTAKDELQRVEAGSLDVEPSEHQAPPGGRAGFLPEETGHEFWADFAQSSNDSVQRTADSVQETGAPRQTLHADYGQTVGRSDDEPSNRQIVKPSNRQIQRFSTLQKILIICIVFVATMLVLSVLRSSQTQTDMDLDTDEHEIATLKVSADAASQADSRRAGEPKEVAAAEKPESASSSREPLSLAVADAFYLRKDYDRAYATYNQLRQALPSASLGAGVADKQDDPLKDFLQLKMAFCMKKAGNTEQANYLFKTLLQSPTPAVRALAAYHQGLAELSNKQYWQARSRAYQTIALVETIDFHRDWALTLERDCHFLVAESLTRNILSLCDADKDLPPQLWHHSLEADPFTNVNEVQLRSLLEAGSNQLREALLGPQIQSADGGQGQHALSRWKVCCYGAPIEELLARFAARAGLDVRWVYKPTGGGPASEAIEDTVRKRPVNLYLSAATPQQALTVAAGCVGLLAQLDEEETQNLELKTQNSKRGTVTIFNPSEYSSLSEHLAMLCQEAVCLWQRFLITCAGDDRVANAHFALGLLAAQTGEFTGAIAEYRLVANRFSQTSLAPCALLHGSRLKVKLRDFIGAREDLKQLIELHPDTEFSDQAYLNLADATMQAGLFDEAARAFRKAYNLGISSQSQALAAFGAGRCFYQKADFEAAAEWLNRFISLTKDSASADLALACFMLGKTYLAQGLPEQASDALEYAIGSEARQGSLAGRLGRAEYIEAVSALVDARTQQGRFVEALNVLDKTQPWQFSQQESVEMLLLRAKVLRSMGLFDKAILVLADRAEYLLDTQLKARVLYELAKCRIAGGEPELARKNLTEALVLIEPGPFAHEVRCELAEVCSKLGQDSQAASICSVILEAAPSAPIRQRAMGILARVHVHQKNYERAVLALLGQPSVTEKPDIESTIDN